MRQPYLRDWSASKDTRSNFDKSKYTPRGTTMGRELETWGVGNIQSGLAI
jgi:hypothetical protein